MEYLGMRTKRSKRENCRFTQDEESPGLISKQLQIASLKNRFVDVEWQSINQINNLSLDLSLKCFLNFLARKKMRCDRSDSN